MNQKPIPGRRRFLQALVAAPLAGIAGGKIIAQEIAKVASGNASSAGMLGPSENYGSSYGSSFGTAFGAPVQESFASALRTMIEARKSVAAESRERRADYIVDTSSIDALRSISTGHRRRMYGDAHLVAEIRSKTKQLDRQIAELRKQCDPLDLIGLVDAA